MPVSTVLPSVTRRLGALIRKRAVRAARAEAMLLLMPPTWLTLVGNARVTPLRMGPCESAAWPLVQAALDKLPVFTVANSEEQPLQYQVGERKLAVFYADVKVATKEYIAARDRAEGGETALVGCDIIQIGLGAAYKLSVEGTAMIVPGMAELRAAGAPEDAQPIGQELPLFACMEMKLQGDAGPKGSTPFERRYHEPTLTPPHHPDPILPSPCPCPTHPTSLRLRLSLPLKLSLPNKPCPACACLAPSRRLV